jgi:hypothetical protein
MAEPPGFFSREAGQARRRALNDLLNEGADYFLRSDGYPGSASVGGRIVQPYCDGGGGLC